MLFPPSLSCHLQCILSHHTPANLFIRVFSLFSLIKFYFYPVFTSVLCCPEAFLPTHTSFLVHVFLKQYPNILPQFLFIVPPTPLLGSPPTPPFLWLFHSFVVSRDLRDVFVGGTHPSAFAHSSSIVKSPFSYNSIFTLESVMVRFVNRSFLPLLVGCLKCHVSFYPTF